MTGVILTAAILQMVLPLLFVLFVAAIAKGVELAFFGILASILHALNPLPLVHKMIPQIELPCASLAEHARLASHNSTVTSFLNKVLPNRGELEVEFADLNKMTEARDLRSNGFIVVYASDAESLPSDFQISSTTGVLLCGKDLAEAKNLKSLVIDTPKVYVDSVDFTHDARLQLSNSKNAAPTEVRSLRAAMGDFSELATSNVDDQARAQALLLDQQKRREGPKPENFYDRECDLLALGCSVTLNSQQLQQTVDSYFARNPNLSGGKVHFSKSIMGFPLRADISEPRVEILSDDPKFPLRGHAKVETLGTILYATVRANLRYDSPTGQIRLDGVEVENISRDPNASLADKGVIEAQGVKVIKLTVARFFSDFVVYDFNKKAGVANAIGNYALESIIAKNGQITVNLSLF